MPPPVPLAGLTHGPADHVRRTPDDSTQDTAGILRRKFVIPPPERDDSGRQDRDHHNVKHGSVQRIFFKREKCPSVGSFDVWDQHISVHPMEGSDTEADEFHVTYTLRPNRGAADSTHAAQEKYDEHNKSGSWAKPPAGAVNYRHGAKPDDCRIAFFYTENGPKPQRDQIWLPRGISREERNSVIDEMRKRADTLGKSFVETYKLAGASPQGTGQAAAPARGALGGGGTYVPPHLRNRQPAATSGNM